MSIIRYQLLLSSKEPLLVIAFVCSLVLLSSCASAPLSKSKAPLTAEERQFLARIDPNATVVAKITEQTIEVSNPTYPAMSILNLWGGKRLAETFDSVKEVYPHDLWIYQTAARRYCASLGQYPDWGIESGPNSMRFTCRQPKEWAVSVMRRQAIQCEELQGWEFYYRPSGKHPCESGPDKVPAEFCAAYSNLTNLSLTSKLTCPAFLNQVKAIEARLTGSPATGQTLGGVKTMDSAIKECTGLGFTPKTEKHADCVLRLTK